MYIVCRYILRLNLPQDYPFSAPDFMMSTPNGRFATNTKICTTFSSFHPETWTPSYTLTTLLVSFISFYVQSDVAAGAINTSDGDKRRLAKDSMAWNKKHVIVGNEFTTMLPILQHLKTGLQTAASIKAAWDLRYPDQASSSAAAGPKPATLEAVGAPKPAAVASPAKAAAATAPPAPAAAAPGWLAAPAQQNRAPLAVRAPAVDFTAGPAPHRAPAPVKKRAAHGAANDMVELDGDSPVKAARTAHRPTPPVHKPAPAAGDAIDLT
jgi:Ubiquitin-conjugating enzyme